MFFVSDVAHHFILGLCLAFNIVQFVVSLYSFDTKFKIRLKVEFAGEVIRHLRDCSLVSVDNQLN